MKPIDQTERYSLRKIITQNLKQYIIDNHLRPGDKLPSERDFCKMLSVSRTILREALHSLESKGILEIKHGEGTFVSRQFTDPIEENLHFLLEQKWLNPAEIQETRYLLEAAALDAFRNKDNYDWENAERIIKQVTQQSMGDSGRREADIHFHISIIRSLKNDFFAQLATPFITQMPSRSMEPTDWQEYSKEHLCYLDALRKGNIDNAKLLLKDHLGI